MKRPGKEPGRFADKENDVYEAYQTLRRQARQPIPDVADLDLRYTRLAAQRCDDPTRACQLATVGRRIRLLMNQKPQGWLDQSELRQIADRLTALERSRGVTTR